MSSKQVFSLENFINKEGKVDYPNLQDNIEFENAIKEIEEKNLNSFTSEQEEFTFWLNTYNLLVIKGVLRNLEKNASWKGITTPLSRIKFIVLQKFIVGGKRHSLHTIENKILRTKFKDPRLHFAINCATASCPVLPSRTIREFNLKDELQELTKAFINTSGNVRIDEQNNTLTLNPIFKWYKDDFKEQGGVLEFIKKYKENFPQKMEHPKIKYSDYDWTLNSQK